MSRRKFENVICTLPQSETFGLRVRQCLEGICWNLIFNARTAELRTKARAALDDPRYAVRLAELMWANQRCRGKLDERAIAALVLGGFAAMPMLRAAPVEAGGEKK